MAGGATGLAWLVAAVAMSGSLWFSEVAGFTPCRLCWAQRACMYPLVPILALAAVTGRRGWRALGLALATVGAGIAVYHVLVERFPSLESGTCDPANPCSLVWFERFGFVTLPYMALSAFALIATLLLTAGVTTPTEHPAATTPPAPAMPTPDDRPGEPAPRLVARSFRRSAVSASPASPAGDADVTALEENLS